VIFKWDATKARANKAKHGVTFEEAETVLMSPLAITVSDTTHSGSEPREKTIGVSDKLRILFVIHTEPMGQTIRIISARKADAQERRDYEEELKNRLP